MLEPEYLDTVTLWDFAGLIKITSKIETAQIDMQNFEYFKEESVKYRSSTEGATEGHVILTIPMGDVCQYLKTCKNFKHSYW